MIYLVGSLRNPDIPHIAAILRESGHEVFDDWFAAGPQADDYWQDYENQRGHSYLEALSGNPAHHVFEYDKKWLDRCDVGVLAMPAGKSGHLELGYLIGQGKPGYVLFNQTPDRYDVMYKLCAGLAFSIKELLQLL